MIKMRFIYFLKHLVLYFLFSSLNLGAQSGAIDLSFNPNDLGFENGSGPNSFVEDVAIQTDGKIIIVGSFTKYNGIARQNIARINIDGSLDLTFNPGYGAQNYINEVAIQPDGKIVIVGNFTFYNGVGRNRIARINVNGSLDTSFNPGSGGNNSINTVSILDDGKLLIGGRFTSYNGVTRNKIARLNTNGSLDTTFNPGIGANDYLINIAIQPDGKILICGVFTSYNGVLRNKLARLFADGSLDIDFNVNITSISSIESVAVQSDGKILIGGWHTINNILWGISRLNTNGSVDTTFNTGSGTNSIVNDIKIQPDGKIIIVGSFGTYNDIPRNRIARINIDGSLDTSFNPGAGANSTIYCVAIQNDGKINFGGEFTFYNGINFNYSTRINNNGTLDTSFNPLTGASNTVTSIALQSDNKIIIGGSFLGYNGLNRNRICRINLDGSIDTSFNPGSGTNFTVNAIGIQSDSKIIIAGGFTIFNGTALNYIARLNADGSLDSGFSSGIGTSYHIYSIAIQSDDKIMIGGSFVSYNGTTCSRIARLNSNGDVDNSFNSSTGANENVNCISIQDDGKIIIGGNFTSYKGIACKRLARLNSDGTLDNSFNSNIGADNTISTIAIQSDGKIAIGGIFTSYNNILLNRLARVNPDGSLDPTFNIGSGANNAITSIEIQTDGRLVIGGTFTSFNGNTRNRIARLNTNGSIDNSFLTGTGANNSVNVVKIQFDGKILVGGSLTSYNNTGRNRILRINSACTSTLTRTWSGSFNNDWNNDLNWSPPCKPESNSPVIIPNTLVLPVIPNGTFALAKSIELQTGAVLTIQPIGSLIVED